MNYKGNDSYDEQIFGQNNKNENQNITDEAYANIYEDLFNDLINGDEDNKNELLESIISLDWNEKIIPQDIVTKYGIVQYVCNMITNDIDDEIKEKMFRLLTFFTCYEYTEVLTESFFATINDVIMNNDAYLSYALTCFLNLYSSQQLHDYIQENFDFSYFQIFCNEETDIDVMETILQIYTIFTSNTNLDYEVASSIKNVAIFALENSKHLKLLSPALFVIYNVLVNCDGICEDIYNDNFISSLNKTLYSLEPNVLCPAIDICAFLIQKDYDMSEQLHLSNIVTLITHQNSDVQNKVIDLLIFMVNKFDDSLLEELIKNSFIPKLIECFESVQGSGKINAAELVNLLFHKASSRNIRRFIREKLYLVVLEWVDFENETIRSYILPILDIVFTEAQNAGMLDYIVSEFSEKEGFNMFDELIEMSQEPTETDARIEAFTVKFGL